MFIESLLVGVILQSCLAGQVSSGTCEEATSGEETGKCAQGKCDVIIGENQYCSQCSTPTEFPIDGICTTEKSTNTECTTGGKCTSCMEGYFLHKGGCYSIAPEKPGHILCIEAINGVCTQGADGYFAVPGALKTGESIVTCSDSTTGVTTSSGTYKGRANCEKCEPPPDVMGFRTDRLARCTRCTESRYVKTDGSCAEDANGCISGTEFGKVDVQNGNRCILCSDEINGGIADCNTCSKREDIVACSACNGAKKPNKAGTGCFECPGKDSTANCERCSADNACEVCSNNNYLTPTNLCLANCDGLPGYFMDTEAKQCVSCSKDCKECTGKATQCTACSPGRMLAYDKEGAYPYGTCVDQCVVAEGTVPGTCGTCGAKIGGTAYCSKCNVAAEVPVNGVCETNNARNAPCAEADNAGGCNRRADGYFLFERGCYKTDKQPGMQVCSDATGINGLCKTCANGLPADNGNCFAQKCHPSCKTCSTAGDASKCKVCADGYYRETAGGTDGECKPCSQGKPGCTLCKHSGAGFTCLSTDPFNGDGDDTKPVDPSSSNESSLSTGAIAGISVAVIVVVGGLVSFLCWWFICRGKA
ncbi:VSP [Giardia lamblia P15]|uniref:VSP n=1 Tax=Giardia intestinalis (strain P15) TaxID=658858 RepID=E1F4N7_GIAIA|nr:VSP [Giardia lamblia P15]